MNKQDQILTELKLVRTLIAKLIGSHDLPEAEQFSVQLVEKAAKEFNELSKKRGDWVSETDLYGLFSGAHYGVGKFLRTEFCFSHYFVQGKSHYYNRKSVMSLAKLLKERNVSLSRYMELRAEEENFDKKILSAASNKSSSKRAFVIHDNLVNIQTSSAIPPVEVIKEDLENLKSEFNNAKLDRYIDIYRGSYAMVKFEYSFSKYFSKDIKAQSKKWCENFNYANRALELLGNKKPKFIPESDDMIQL